MKWKALKKIADPDSIECKIDSRSGIVTVTFSVAGAGFTSQYDPDNIGVYAICLEDPELFFDHYAPLKNANDTIKPAKVAMKGANADGYLDKISTDDSDLGLKEDKS
jgi:hypothetical protein